MRVTCLTSFMDGKRPFVRGDFVTVSDADGERFKANGWATEGYVDLPVEPVLPVEGTGSATTLVIDNSTSGSGDNMGT